MESKMKKIDFERKFRQVSPLNISPLALAVAACGDGAGGTSTDTMAKAATGTMARATTFPLTGNKFKDASTQGSKWSPENNILTYAVADGFNGEQWDNISTVNSQLTMAMQQVAQFTNLKVQNLGNFNDATEAANAGATIVLSLDGSVISDLYGNNVWAVGFSQMLKTIHMTI